MIRPRQSNLHKVPQWTQEAWFRLGLYACLWKNIMEEWKKIPGFEGYEVSNYGGVRSYRRKNGLTIKPHNLKPLDSKGYYHVCLMHDKRSFRKRIHRLVLECFVGCCPENMQGCHNNGISKDNRLSNLRWDSAKNNTADKTTHGTQQVGERNPSAKLKETDIPIIFSLREKGWSLKKIGNLFEVSFKTIWAATKGDNWNHLKIKKDLES